MVQVIPQSDPWASIGQAAGKGVSSGLEMLMKEKIKDMTESRKKKAAMGNYEDLIARGFTPNEASLWMQFTEGGKTQLSKEIVDRMQRAKGLEKRGLGIEQPSGEEGGDQPLAAEEEVQVSPDGEEELVFEEQLGRTPKERVAHQEQFDKRSFERNKKYLERQSDILTDMPKKKVSIAQMEGAMNAGDFNSVRNAASELFGQEFLKTGSAQLVNAASKQYLLSSLAGITGRPNQFLERSITKALISPLYKDEANKLILEGIKGIADIEEYGAQEAARIEEKYTKKGREVPRNFQKIVRDKVEKKGREFEKTYAESIRKLLSPKKEKQIKIAKAKQGEKLNIELAQQFINLAKGDKEKAKKLARQHGYKL